MKKLLVLFLASQILFSGSLMVFAEDLPNPPEEQEQEQEPPQDPEPEPEPEPDPDPQPEPEPDPNQEDQEDQEEGEEVPDLFAIKINEILADPVEPETEGEFIELYNSGDMAIDLSGWVLDDEVLDDNYNYAFDNPDLNYILEPDHYLTFYRPETAITLNNDGDAVYLFNEQMDEIDYHVFESTSVGRSWGRDLNELEKWVLLPTPSPSAENTFINNPPVADIHVQGGTGGMKLNVTGENSSDSDGDKLTYLWEFEPGVFNEAENPTTYEFISAGNKTVKLTVTDEFGLIDEANLPFIAANAQQQEEQQEIETEQENEESDEETEPIQNENEENTPIVYAKLSLINEFLPDPEGADGEGEWVELYNASDKPIDLSGWYLDDEEAASAPFKIPEKMTLHSKSYLLFKGLELNLSLKNSADVVRLLNPNKEESERVGYSESKEGFSYAKNLENKFVWTATPTPKTENKFPPPPKPYAFGVVRFDSVLPNPEGTDTGKEKIILKNMSAETLNLIGWKLANSSTEKELPVISILPNAKKEISSAEFGLTLKNTDETLKLFDPTGQLIDEISWKTSASDQWLFNANVLQNGMVVSVISVIDGDTFKITVEGKTLTVRLLGVDTPETLHPFKPVEHYGKQASDYLKNLLLGKQVILNFEEKKIDAYGRVLAYVYLADQFVNAEVIKQGYGYAYTKYPFQFLNEFVAYQNEAKAAERGLWADPEVAAEIEKTIQEDLAKPEEQGNGNLLSLTDEVEESDSEELDESEEEVEDDTSEDDSKTSTSQNSSPTENTSQNCHSDALKLHSLLPYPKKGVTEEYIKIINNGKETICLTGWQLDDTTDGGSKPYKMKDGQIKAGEILEFGKADTKLSLNNSNDCATLINPKGEVADQICYGKTKEGEVLTQASGSTNVSDDKTTTTKKTTTKNGGTASTDVPKYTFNRESSAYRADLINNSFLGKVLGMDDIEKILVVELEDGKIVPVSYAHSLFDMKMLKALIKLEKMLMFEVYQGADFAYLISVYDPDNLKGAASERSSAWMILLLIPLGALAVLIWKYRATILTLRLFRWLKTN